MNFISVAISVLLTNFFIRFIINILPFRKKRFWHLIIISLYDASVLITYTKLTFDSLAAMNSYNLALILEGVGGILGVVIAYITTLMVVLDGVKIFKSKRLKEFERGYNLKDGKSLPKNIVGGVFMLLFLLLIGYSIFLIINYDKLLLTTIIGSIIIGLIFLGLSIYFFISGKAVHQTIKAQKLMLVINLPFETLTYIAELNKTLSENEALGKMNEMYYLDELGLLITPSDKFIVKGMKADSIPQEYLSSIKMQKLDNRYDYITSNYKKYSRMKITIDENGNIIKNQPIK